MSKKRYRCWHADEEERDSGEIYFDHGPAWAAESHAEWFYNESGGEIGTDANGFAFAVMVDELADNDEIVATTRHAIIIDFSPTFTATEDDTAAEATETPATEETK